MRSEWLGSLLAKGFYIKASFPYLWIIDATLCHIVRWKDQLVEGQTWIEVGLKRILKDRIFVPLSFRRTCECKQTNPSSILKRKNPISKIWPSTDYIIKQSIASYCVQLLQNIQGRQQHDALLAFNNSIVRLSPCFPERYFCNQMIDISFCLMSWLKKHCHWNRNWRSTRG